MFELRFMITRARRDAHGSDESSLDSDATLELHLSDGKFSGSCPVYHPCNTFASGLGDLSDGPLSDDLRLHSPPLLSDR